MFGCELHPPNTGEPVENLYALLVGIKQLLWKSVQADLILLFFIHYIFVGFFFLRGLLLFFLFTNRRFVATLHSQMMVAFFSYKVFLN